MLIATFALATLLPVLLVLACPLLMIYMMRGMHGDHGRAVEPKPRTQMSMDELKHERDALNEEIGQRAERMAAR